MTTRAAFLQAIRSAPNDDLPRLVYADWLDEQGEGERAEFIRLQCAKGRQSRKAANRWVTRNGRRYFGQGFQHRERWWYSTVSSPESTIGFDRGFVADFDGEFSVWLSHSDRILPESVGLTVRLTDRPQTWTDYLPGGVTRHTMAPQGYPFPDGQSLLGWHTLEPGSHILTGLLKAEWPDVAAWELPPEGRPPARAELIDLYQIGLISRETLLREVELTNPQHGTATPPASD